jgi:hypothetical protein
MSNNMTFTDPALYNVVAAPPPAAASFHHAAAVPPAPFYNVPAAPPPAAPFHSYAGVPMPPAAPFHNYAAAPPPAAPFHNYAAVPMPPAAPFQNYAPLSHAALFVPSPPPVPIDVPVRKVWARNFTAEMDALDAFATRASHVAVNVQYPGVLHEDPGSSATAEKRYAVLKANVDALKPLQLGLAVLRDDGQCKAWEFHLAGFDRESDPYSADSVEYLQARGMRLDALRVGGVPVSLLSMRLHHCGLLRRPGLAWVTYDGAAAQGAHRKPAATQRHRRVTYDVARMAQLARGARADRRRARPSQADGEPASYSRCRCFCASVPVSTQDLHR